MCVVCMYICVTSLLWTIKWCILICNKPLEYSLLNPYTLRLIDIGQLYFTMNIKLIVASLQYWYLVMVQYIFIRNKSLLFWFFIHCEIYIYIYICTYTQWYFKIFFKLCRSWYSPLYYKSKDLKNGLLSHVYILEQIDLSKSFTFLRICLG